MRGRDRFWKHVVEENNRSVCKYCGDTFAPNNINRMKKHLAKVGRGQGIRECTQVPDDVRDEAEKAIGNPGKKVKTASCSTDVQDRRKISSSSNIFSEALQSSFQEVVKQDDLNKKLAKFLLHHNIEFNAVESPSFEDFFSTVIERGHDYKLPSSSVLRANFLPEIEMEVEKYVEEVKKSWKTTGCTLMLEKTCNFIIVMIYSHKGAIFVGSYDEKDNNNKMEGIVASTIEKYGVDNVVQFITNSSEILQSVGNMLKAKYPRIFQIQCVAQQIHSLLKDIYDKVDWVRMTIDGAEEIIKCIYGDRDAIILSLIRKHTNGRELKLPCKSKFASKYQMLQSIFKNKDELQQLVSSPDWKNLLDSDKNVKASTITSIFQRSNFWCQGQEVLEVMEPIVQVLCLVEDDRSTSGYLYEAMTGANKAIEQQNESDPTKYGRILALWEEKRRNIIHPILHPTAAFLNPAYKFQDNLDWDENMRKGINWLLENMVESNEEKDRFTHEYQLYRDPKSKVFDCLSSNFMKSFHPCEWWNDNGPRLPVLRKCAFRILSQTCKCSCNIKPSAFEVAQKKMNSNRIAPNLQYLTMNTIIMERFRTEQEQHKARILLEHCKELPDYVDPEEDLEVDQMKSAQYVNLDDDGTHETDLLGLKDKVPDDKEILERLVVHIQSLINNLGKEYNVKTLKTVIAQIQEKIHDEANMKTSVQNRQVDPCSMEQQGSKRNDNYSYEYSFDGCMPTGIETDSIFFPGNHQLLPTIAEPSNGNDRLQGHDNTTPGINHDGDHSDVLFWLNA